MRIENVENNGRWDEWKDRKKRMKGTRVKTNEKKENCYRRRKE